MRICLIVRALPLHRLGGLEFHTWDLANALQQRGHEIHIVTSAVPPANAENRATSDNEAIRIHHVSSGSSGNYSLAFFRGAAALAADVATKEKCDLVHSQEYAGMFFSDGRKPNVCTVHGTMFTEVPLDRRYFHRLSATEKTRAAWNYKTRILLHLPFRNMIRRAHQLLVDSEFSFREVVRMDPNARPKLNLVPLGLDFSRYVTRNGIDEANQPARPLRIALLGRLQEQKGLRIAFQAAALLRSRGVPFVMNVGGAGDFSSEMHRLINEQGLQEIVVLHGRIPQENVSGFLHSNDLFLFPDLTQPAFGLVAVEAMHQGLPVIGARSGAIPEVVMDDCGWLYDAWSAHELASLLQHLSENRSEIAAKADNAADRAAQYSAAAMAERTEQVYLKALSLGARSTAS